MDNQRDRLQEMLDSLLQEIDEEINMTTDRQSYEALYKVAYRRHHELLGEIEDLLSQYFTMIGLTGDDAMGLLRRLHEKYIVHDWRH